jgi:hypothetical protein
MEDDDNVGMARIRDKLGFGRLLSVAVAVVFSVALWIWSDFHGWSMGRRWEAVSTGTGAVA